MTVNFWWIKFIFCFKARVIQNISSNNTEDNTHQKTEEIEEAQEPLKPQSQN
ncbi:hypothetical protein [Mesomycoplasma ovipneumoniae]|uniref:hypothetical protein n=1 Tax=Mesomycoplasma ovipneumoniae TaxID=29562 RepID=UPI0020CBD68D|nr:hypothetical protein [Mesomycoplasma ovipneumoniae]MCP9306309.1 hypothetical protein [Mesomycoplasma ovipneumoniae]